MARKHTKRSVIEDILCSIDPVKTSLHHLENKSVSPKEIINAGFMPDIDIQHFVLFSMSQAIAIWNGYTTFFDNPMMLDAVDVKMKWCQRKANDKDILNTEKLLSTYLNTIPDSEIFNRTKKAICNFMWSLNFNAYAAHEHCYINVPDIKYKSSAKTIEKAYPKISSEEEIHISNIYHKKLKGFLWALLESPYRSIPSLYKYIQERKFLSEFPRKPPIKISESTKLEPLKVKKPGPSKSHIKNLESIRKALSEW